MKYKIAVAAFAVSIIAFSAAAQQPSDRRPNEGSPLRLAQAKPCPSVHFVFPKRKDAQAELSGPLSKDHKWDKDCVAHIVGTFNLAVDKEEQKLKSAKCDPNLTQAQVEQDIANYTKHYDIAIKLQCQHPVKP